MKTPCLHSPLRRLQSGGWLPAFALAFLTMVGALRAEVYLKLEGIDGEAPAGRFSGWIPLDSVDASVAATPVIPPATTSPAAFGLRVLKRLDKATPLLLVKCCLGEHIPKATFAFVDGQTPYLRITLYDVLISSIASGGGTSPPQEEVSFTYQKIEWSITGRDGDGGGTTATFDTASQTGGAKPRLPFKASLDQTANGTLSLSCPVESGHTYRVRSNASLDGPWETVSEFTATTDGIVEQSLPIKGQALFYRVEEVE